MVRPPPHFTLGDMNKLKPVLGLMLLGCVSAQALQVGTLPLVADTPGKLLSLSPEAIAQIYPQNNRPEAVYLTADKKVSLAFEQRSAPLKPGEISGLVGQYPAIIKSQVPGLKSLVSKQLTIGGTPWAQFVYTLPGKDGERRRETLLGSVGGKLLMLNVDSTTADYSKNQVEVRSFINSLHMQ